MDDKQICNPNDDTTKLFRLNRLKVLVYNFEQIYTQSFNEIEIQRVRKRGSIVIEVQCSLPP